MERKKIGKEDFEGIIAGVKDIREYMEIDPAQGESFCFGVRTASNPDYLTRAIYEMYESNLSPETIDPGSSKPLSISWTRFNRSQ